MDKDFNTEIQNFTHFFLTLKNGKDSQKKITPINSKKVAELKEELMYYDYGIKIYRTRNKGPSNQNHLHQNPKSKDIKLAPEYDKGQNFWILKPNDLNRGRGVELFSTLDELKGY